jgi:nucleotide-binding universal stress UspA family protein/hemerythrin-like domain-containing protein
MYRHILAPIDGSAPSIVAVDQVVEFAHLLGAKVTFFHARKDTATAGAVARKDTATAEAAGAGRAILAKAEAAARARNVDHDSELGLCKRPYEGILKAAADHHCDLIFLSSRGNRGVAGLMLGSQTQKILANATIPVLVAGNARTDRTPELNAALSAYKDEHRSIAAVMHGLSYLVEDAEDAEDAPDFALVRAMLHYLRAFPQARHHPREEQVLFPKLRRLTNHVDHLIGELCADHVAEQALTAELDTALELWAEGAPGAQAIFAGLVARLAEATWRHIALEDTVILDHAQALFTEQDWKEVAEAFAGDLSPTIALASDYQFHRLFSRIMALAPASRVSAAQ